jgi:hypothetical protein
MMPVPTSATVTFVPPKRVNVLVLPLRVNLIGKVAVVPVGMASLKLIVR